MSRSFVAVVWLLACPLAVMAQTRVDVDRQKDFTLYKTFAVEVAPPINIHGEKDVDNTLAQDRFRNAVTRELVARGLEPTDLRPDLTVRVASRVTERTEIQSFGLGAYPWGWYGPAGYWGGWYGGWGPYGADLATYTYLEGSVTIDVIDNDTNQLVYRGQTRRQVGHHLDKATNRAVYKAFKKFPIEKIGERD